MITRLIEKVSAANLETQACKKEGRGTKENRAKEGIQDVKELLK